MHSGVVDSFINTVAMANRLGIGKRLLVSTKNEGPQQVTVERLNNIYNAADVGINTSLGEGWGLCLDKNTSIWTKQGIFKICDVTPGSEVVTHTGQWRKVLNVIPTGKKKLLQLTSSTERILRCSKDHLLMTETGWKKAGDLRIGDLVEFVKPKEFKEDVVHDLAKSKNMLCDDNFVWYRHRAPGDFRTFKRFISVKRDLSEIIGMFLASGKVIGNVASIITKSDKQISILSNKLNALGIIDSLVTIDRIKKRPRIDIKEPWMVEFLTTYFGIKPKKCVVPDEYFEVRLDTLIKSFVETKYNTAGRRIFFYAMSNKVAAFIAFQLYMSEICGSAKLRVRSRGSLFAEFSRTNFPGIRGSENRINVIIKDGRIFNRIDGIAETEELETYDLHVDVDHSYSANGFIVHNCNVEHAATGAPQIVPDHSACKELFEDCGLLLPVTMDFTLDNIMTEGGLVSPEAVAEALEKIYNNVDLYKELSEKSYKKFNNPTLGWDNLAKVWHKVFMGVVDVNNLA